MRILVGQLRRAAISSDVTRLESVTSLLFTPPERLERAQKYFPSCFVLDLEDSVPSTGKIEARTRVQSAIERTLGGFSRVVVRPNKVEDLSLLKDDLAQCLIPGVHGLMLPKVESAEDMVTFDELVDHAERVNGLPVGNTRYVVLVETPMGAENVADILDASPRTLAVCPGHGDYLALTGGERTPEALGAFRWRVLNAAKARGIQVVDTPFLDIPDERGLRAECQLVRSFGFDGKICIHPAHVSTIHAVFAPTLAEQRFSEEVLSSIGDSQAIVRLSNGSMAGPPHSKHARVVLARHAAETERRLQMKVAHRGESRDGKPQLSHGAHLPRPWAAAAAGGDRQAPRCARTLLQTSDVTFWRAAFGGERVLREKNEHGSATHVPFSFALNLSLASVVDRVTEPARIHLGLENAVLGMPPFIPCDGVCEVLAEARPVRGVLSKDGRTCDVETLHTLSPGEGQPQWFSVTKHTRFDAAVAEEVFPGLRMEPRTRAADANRDQKADPLPLLGGMASAGYRVAHTRSKPDFSSIPPLASGDTIVHRGVQRISTGTNAMLNRLTRNSHQLHANPLAFTHVVVPGPYVHAAVFALGDEEIGTIGTTNMAFSSNMAPVLENDILSAVSRVASVERLNEDFEIVNLVTVGLQGLDPLRELPAIPLPEDLFAPHPIKRVALRMLCEKWSPSLLDRVVLRAHRTILRPSAGL